MEIIINKKSTFQKVLNHPPRFFVLHVLFFDEILIERGIHFLMELRDQKCIQKKVTVTSQNQKRSTFGLY